MGEIHADDPMQGQLVDDQGRCQHGKSEEDVVCFRLAGDGWRFWTCIQCANEANITVQPWGAAQQHELAVQCGICRSILSIKHFMAGQEAPSPLCPHCKAPWARFSRDELAAVFGSADN